MNGSRFVVLVALALVAVGLISSPVTAQPPAQPYTPPSVEVVMRWTSSEPFMNEPRQMILPDNLRAQIYSEIGFRLLGDYTCTQDTDYLVQVAFLQTFTELFGATNQPQDREQVIFTVRQGAYQASQPSQLEWKEGPYLDIAWNIEAPVNHTHEYVVGTPEDGVRAQPGDCTGNPSQRVSTNPETMNVTRPYVEPDEADVVTCTDDPLQPKCQGLEEVGGGSPGFEGLAVMVAFAAMTLAWAKKRRPQ